MSQRRESETTPAPKGRLQTLRFRFSLRLNDVLFPIDAGELAYALTEAGYATPKIPPAKARIRVGFGGEIARKNGIVIDGNSDRGVLGVTAKSYDSAIKGYNELKTIINNKLKINLEERSRFFEIIAEYNFESLKNPLESIYKAFSGTRVLKNINGIFEQETSIYSVKFVSKGRVPNQEEWLDVTIEPNLIKPDSVYDLIVIFRSRQKTKVETFGKELETRLHKVVDAIES